MPQAMLMHHEQPWPLRYKDRFDAGNLVDRKYRPISTKSFLADQFSNITRLSLSAPVTEMNE